jgi:hydrogenase maturation protease
MNVLVAGVGNIFLGDDGFGVEVARRLTAEELPGGARVREFGIRGVHLAYEIADGVDTLILVDAMARGEPPGTLTVLVPGPGGLPAAQLDGHSLDPGSVLQLVETLGGKIGRTLVVGCEPESLEEGIGLSSTVEDAVDRAVALVRDLLTKEETR